MKRWIAAVVLLGVFPPAALAQRGGPPRDRTTPTVIRGTASISGLVVSADSGRPLRFARVMATAPELADGGRVTTTDENGRFEIPELPAGRYSISASKTGYIRVNFGQRRPLGAGHPIEVRDGQRVNDIDFRLPRGGVITGRVLDQDGEPVVRASVRTLRYRMVEGEGRIEPGNSAETDDRGQFRIYNLQPGTYFVSATANMADLGSRRTSGFITSDGVVAIEASPTEGAAQNLTYAPTYYPGVQSLSEATPVTVDVSQEAAGIDFTLRLLTAGRVSGMVLGANGPSSNAAVMLVLDDQRGLISNQGTYFGSTNRDGTFTIPNIPPGRYLILARGRGGRGGSAADADLFAVAPLTVTSGSVPGVVLTLGPGLTISGQVTFEGGSTPSAADISRIRISLASGASLPLVGSGQTNVGPRIDGTFTIANVPPGNRTFRVTGAPRPWTVKAVYLDGRDVTDGPIDIRPGETSGRVNVVMTDRAASLSGSVLNAAGRPLVDCTVVAFAADEQMWRPQSRFIQATKPDRNGIYQLRGLPTGEYLVVASEDIEQGEWFDPAVLGGLRPRATRVLVAEGDVKTLDLKAVR